MSLDTDIAPLDTPQSKLTLKDKYFSLKKENRINRMQFFVRNIMIVCMYIIFAILFSCVTSIIATVIAVLAPPMEYGYNQIGLEMAISMLVIGAGCSVPPLIYACIINILKRAHDYNHRGIWYILPSIFFICVPLLDWLFSIPNHIFSIAYLFSLIISLIVFTILQFRKGNPTTNKYGPAPTGKPLI